MKILTFKQVMPKEGDHLN